MHGKWTTIDITEEYDAWMRYAHIHDECGYHYEDSFPEGHNYCPKCGLCMNGAHAVEEYISKKYINNMLDYYLADSTGAEHYAYDTIKRRIATAQVVILDE